MALVIILVQGVLQDDPRVIGHHVVIEGDQVVARLVLRGKETHEAILILVVIGPCRHIHLKADAALVAQGNHRFEHHIPELAVVGDRAGKEGAALDGGVDL